MASTYSPNLRLELIGTGEQQGTWGNTTNTNLGTLLEEAIGGYVSVTVTDGADTTLTTSNGAADQSRNMTINLTGALTAARNVICPAIEKVYIVRNATTGGYAVTFKVSGQTGVSIPNGTTYILYVNGTDAVLATGTIASQDFSNVSITGGSITGITDLAVADGGTGASNAAAARTNLGVGTIATQNSNAVSITGGSISGITDLAVADGGTGASDASTARTNLGVGSIATQNANNVSITGGSISGITDLAVADGGTGASDAATARTNLGIGTMGAQNANAVAITGGTLIANASGISIRDSDASNILTIAVGSNLTANTTLTLTTGASSSRTLDISAANVTITAAGAALIDDADAATQRNTLGLGTIATQAAPSGTVVGTTDTQTLTNKRVTPRVSSLSANSATPALNTDNFDMLIITGQTSNITSMTTNLTGTPTTGQKLWISFTAGSGTPTITWGASFESSTATLPTGMTTTRSDVGFVWNQATSKWRCVAVA